MKLNKVAAVAAVWVMTLGLISSCKRVEKGSEPSIDNYPLTVLGVSFEAAPAKAAVLNSAILETFFDLGYGDKVVAKGELCDDIGVEHSEKAAGIKKCGSLTNPSVTEMKKLGVQVVFTHSEFEESVISELDSAGIKRVILPVPDDLDEIKENYLSISQIFDGKTTGAEAGAESYKRIETAVSDIEQVLADSAAEPMAKGIYLAAKEDFVATPDTLMGKMLPIIGIENLADSDPSASGWKMGSLGDRAAEIEVIFCPEELVPVIKSSDLFKKSPAVKNDFVFGVNSASIERKGRDFFAICRQMAETLKSSIYEQNEPSEPTSETTEGGSTSSATAD